MVPALQAVAAAFAAQHHQHRLPVRDDIAAADAYAAGVHDPTNPEVAASYAALTATLDDQLDALIAAGFTAEPWTGEGQPYATSAAMVADASAGRLFFYLTEADSQMPSDHPMRQGSQHSGLIANDVFRIVHDLLGHAAGGHGFGPEGEYRAWVEHRATLPRQAHPALWAETRGQNCWTNAGAHMRSACGTRLLTRSESGWIPLRDRPFPVQKALAPEADLA